MLKKILLLFCIFLPWALAAQEEIRTVPGDTVMRKVRKIERKEFFTTKPRVYLENIGLEALPTSVPFSYMKSIRFQDGCEVFFDENGLVFDKTLNPGMVTVRGSSFLLEGVYKMNTAEMKTLFGPEVYKEKLKPYRTLYNVGEIVTYSGAALCLPWLCTSLLKYARSEDRDQEPYRYAPPSATVNGLAIAGAACIVSGITMCIIGHNGCKRFAVSFTGNSINLSHQF